MTSTSTFWFVTTVGAALAAASAVALMIVRSRRRLCQAIEPPYRALRA
jgi:hypothetical protein